LSDRNESTAALHLDIKPQPRSTNSLLLGNISQSTARFDFFLPRRFVMQNKMIAYLENQRRTRLWNAFLNPFLEEVVSSIAKEHVPHLLVKAGIRAAHNLPLSPCDTIEQLELEANRHWNELGWGLVTFTEQPEFLEIKHECLPADAPQHEHFSNFLQGLYQQWFRSAGAGEGLQVRLINAAQADVYLYRLVG
jgi:hypothetical protein